MQVDEARRDDAVATVELAVAAQTGADLGDAVVDDERIGRPLAGLVHDPPSAGSRASSGNGAPDPRSSYRTAIRMATPFTTCSVMTEPQCLGDLRCDLDPAVHRTGVHDQHLGS